MEKYFFSIYWDVIDICVYVLKHVQLFVTPWTVESSRLLCSWDFLGKNIGVGCHFLLQRIFPTQGSNRISYMSCIGRLLTMEPPGKLSNWNPQEAMWWDWFRTWRQRTTQDIMLNGILFTPQSPLFLLTQATRSCNRSAYFLYYLHN